MYETPRRGKITEGASLAGVASHNLPGLRNGPIFLFSLRAIRFFRNATGLRSATHTYQPSLSSSISTDIRAVAVVATSTTYTGRFYGGSIPSVGVGIVRQTTAAQTRSYV